MRTGRSGRTGSVPSQAARVSVWKGGVQRGATGVKRAGIEARLREQRGPVRRRRRGAGVRPRRCGGIA